MSDDASKKIDQSEIEQLLEQAKASGPPQRDLAAAQTGAAAAPADPGPLLAQAEIEALLHKAAAQGVPAKASVAAARPAAHAAGESIAQGDIELLINQAQRALASIESPADQPAAAGLKPFTFDEFAGAPPSSEAATIDLIRDVELDLKIELGRTHMYLEDVLRLRKGSVVPLDKLAGDPVDIYVNGRLIARGEVLVLNDNFCVRVAELIAGEVAVAG